jgi:mannose-1-phosphate guanylyltransferase
MRYPQKSLLQYHGSSTQMPARTHDDRKKKKIEFASYTLDRLIIMDAMILAAGQGTRLLPLTRIKPKPLLPVLNQPLLQLILDYLNRFSIDRVILNTHHLASQFENCIPFLRKGGIHELVTCYEPIILNTGGGLVNTRDFFRSNPFMVISGDILTDIDVKKAVDFHQRHDDPVTLVLHDYPEFNQIKVDTDGRILKLRKGDGRGLDFANIHILDQTIFRFLPSSGNFDIIPAYQQMIDEGITVRAYVSQDHYWRNIGTPRSYLKAHEELLTTHFNTFPFLQRGKGVLIHPEACIEKGVEFSGWVCIGRGCHLKKGCHIENSVLWEDVLVEAGGFVSDSIVSNGVTVSGDIREDTRILDPVSP